MDKSQITQKIFDYIDALSQKLGVASQHVMEVLVRQQVIEGISKLAIITLFLLGSLVITTIAIRKIISAPKGALWDDDEIEFKGVVYIVLAVAGGFVLIISLAAFASSFTDHLTQIINPEYKAMKDIMDAIK